MIPPGFDADLGFFAEFDGPREPDRLLAFARSPEGQELNAAFVQSRMRGSAGCSLACSNRQLIFTMRNADIRVNALPTTVEG
ncbi:hypothetical protein AGR8A_pAt20033 [Agrobacterium fabrum str. J-07]|nr:hypothetical protein AGR8A_pAt20033 [Agrobacterium fabrum str. J-07]